MIQIDGVLVSTTLFDEAFLCDLTACKGACCVEGESGAPILHEELQTLQQDYQRIEPYLSEEGKTAITKQGHGVIDQDHDLVTPLIDGKACAYINYENGVAKCGIEKAYLEGKTHFRKPVSCHLYPARVSKVGEYEAVNYHRWSICDPARKCGAKANLPIYRFLKDGLVRRFGETWYTELEIVAQEYQAWKKDN